jgi:hypothetical protein
MMKTHYTRLYADADGESHFEVVEAELESVDFAPPAPPLNLSAFLPATQMAFFGAPAGWRGDWHPASARNLYVVISGEWEVEASDGTVRRFPPNSVLLAEDTTGKGHKSAAVSDEDSLALLVQLAT